MGLRQQLSSGGPFRDIHKRVPLWGYVILTVGKNMFRGTRSMVSPFRDLQGCSWITWLANWVLPCIV